MIDDECFYSSSIIRHSSSLIGVPQGGRVTKSKVAVAKTSPQTVLDDYHNLLRLADLEGFLSKDKVTILKDNISWHYPFPGANTTPWQLEGTILALKKLGFGQVVAVENNTVVTNTLKGERLNKYEGIFKKHDVEVKLNFSDDFKWIKYEPKGELLALPKIYKKGIFLPEFFFDKNIIHLPTLKCHIYTTTTGAMKNAFGGLLTTKRHYTHTWIHETLVDLLTIQKEIHSGVFAVMDGTTAGNGPGPRTMKPEIKDYILASGDSVAIDAVAAKMMGFDPMSIKYIRLAHERGLGKGRMEEIEILGEDISQVNFGFTVGDNMASRVGDLLWFSPLRIFQRLFFRTPLVYIFVFGSAFYHDRFWWPVKGTKILKEWSETKWGKLFQTY
ncbi:MAG: DUF362 domain-containing protein [candidate division Zixibacteria bacterium]|nr:DUF362 domain-containing protein [candidate division Zixibacteria bacterium]